MLKRKFPSWKSWKPIPARHCSNSGNSEYDHVWRELDCYLDVYSAAEGAHFWT